MLPLATLQLIPATLLLFLATAPTVTRALDNPWSFDLGHFLNHAPGNRFWTRKEEAKITQSMAQLPIAVRKMSDDRGQMFFPEYWHFEPESNGASELERNIVRHEPRSSSGLEDESAVKDWANASIPQPLQAPFSLHASGDLDTRPLFSRFFGSPKAIFARASGNFACPNGTSDCASINRPYSCCAAGLVCQLTTDSGLGDVGCCNPGQVCGQEVSGCPAQDLTCADSLGGGCCIPGSVCVGVGCVVGTTVTSLVEPTVTESPRSSSKSSTSSSSTTSSPASTVPLTSTSTSTATTSTTATVTGSSSHSSSSSHPSSTSTTQSTSSPAVALRPTSSAGPTTTTTAAPVTVTPSQCPTGYFQCSAYYHGGCCQVGRDCSLTSCPVASSTLAVNSDGVTVAVPSVTDGAGAGSVANGCAQGWFSCPSGQGGGCCPSGYACGTSCTATGVVVQGGATGTAKVAKDNGAERADVRSWMVIGLIGLLVFLVA